MVLIILAIVISVGLLMWFWKGPVQTMADAMKRNGSSTSEAYGVIILLASAMGVSIYLIASIL